MQELVSDMLSLAQAESTETYEFARTNLSSIVSKEALQFESVAFERNVTIEDGIAEGMHVQGKHPRAGKARRHANRQRLQIRCGSKQRDGAPLRQGKGRAFRAKPGKPHPPRVH